MRIRIISALIALPLLLFAVIKGGIILKASVLVLAMIAIGEFFEAFHHIDIFPSKRIGIFSVIALAYFSFYSTSNAQIMLWFFINIIIILSYNLFGKAGNPVNAGITFLGIFYIVYFIYHIVFILNLDVNKALIWMIFISAWASDTFAYFVGTFFGSRKIFPNISPKKTIEGVIGGVLGCIITSGLFAYYFIPNLVYHCMVMGFIGSIMSILGDLTASLFKRYVGIKDYGKIMPGHGGIMDRFDSILFTAPTIYYYIVFFINN